MTEKLIVMADRAMELFETKSPHQLAVELVAMQAQRDHLTYLLREARSSVLALAGIWHMEGMTSQFDKEIALANCIDDVLAATNQEGGEA